MQQNILASKIFTLTMIFAIFICCICDLAISGMLTWSLIVLRSVFIAWTLAFPIILLGKKGILPSMIGISIFIIPFIYILSVLIKADKMFKIGTATSIISLIFMWTVYLVFRKLKKRILSAFGIASLIAIPFILLINFILSKLIGGTVIDLWDISAILILSTAATAFISADRGK